MTFDPQKHTMVMHGKATNGEWLLALAILKNEWAHGFSTIMQSNEFFITLFEEKK